MSTIDTSRFLAREKKLTATSDAFTTGYYYTKNPGKEDNNYIHKRGQAYARQIDPFMQEAMAELILEGRPELIEELKAKRAKIKLKHPKETL